MNEKELATEAINTVKRDGWMKGVMNNSMSECRSHCILGSIGKARWEEWDDDVTYACEPYLVLREDETTRALINRVARIVTEKNEWAKERAIQRLHCNPPRSEMEEAVNAQDVTWRWNDRYGSYGDVLEVLGMARDEI